MRMLQIVGDSKYGGDSFLVVRFALTAMKHGWEVEVLATDPPFVESLANHGVPCVDLDVIHRSIRPIRDWRGLRTLTRFLRKHSYDLVHTHTSKGGVIGRRAARLAGIPAIVHTVHGFGFHEESGWLSKRLFSTVEKAAAKWCDRIVTVSNYHRDLALELKIGTEEQVIAIPNGIPIPPCTDEETIDKVRQELNLRENEKLLLSTGRLSEQKGLIYLVKAVKLMIDGGCEAPFRVVLAGDGPLRSELEQAVSSLQVEEYVQFLGFRRDVPALLAASDMVVIPSLWEGLSIGLLEALALAKPVITTTIGSNMEVCRDGQGAVLVPSKDPMALAEAMRHLLTSPDACSDIAQTGHRIYRETYTEERMLDSYMRLYQKFTA